MIERETRDSREGFAIDEQAAYECCAECGELADECVCEDWDECGAYWDEHDGQPDEQQEWDDLYGYGPEFDSYDGGDDW